MSKIENEAKNETAVEKDAKEQLDVKSVEPRSVVKLERIKTGFKAGVQSARCN